MVDPKARVLGRRAGRDPSFSEQPTLLSRVQDLVQTNAKLRAENARLNELVASIERALDGERVPTRRGAPEEPSGQVVTLDTVRIARKAPPLKRSGRAGADAITLEKRRAGLAKARSALAVKRAAARSSG